MKDEKSEGEEICRQETVYVFTERSALACSALATVWFFSCRPPQLGCLAESEKNKFDIRDRSKIILSWTSSQLCGYKYAAQMQRDVFTQRFAVMFVFFLSLILTL